MKTLKDILDNLKRQVKNYIEKRNDLPDPFALVVATAIWSALLQGSSYSDEWEGKEKFLAEVESLLQELGLSEEEIQNSKDQALELWDNP